MSYFLGIKVSQRDDGIFISQKKYTEDLLNKFKMYWYKPVSTPLVMNEKLQKVDGAPEADASRYRSLVGSLLYLTATRPDIMFATSLLSRFMQNPSQIHLGVGKRILRYLQGTKEYGIWYKSTGNPTLLGYTDSDWAGSVDDMRAPQAILSHLDQEYSLGRQRSKPQLHNQPLKQNMWQPLKQ